jgi:hypothetical protein
MHKRQSQIREINLAIVSINEIKYCFADTFYDTLAIYNVQGQKRWSYASTPPKCLHAIMLK